MKKCFIVLLIILCLLLANFSYAETNAVLADPVFYHMSASLQANKKLTISVITRSNASLIKVDACTLQIQVGTVWQDVCSLVPPSHTTTNTNVYGTTIDYSSSIGVGTYRIVVTMNADGYTKDVSSNAKTFSS